MSDRQCVMIYQLEDRLAVITLSRTETGLWLGDPGFAVLSTREPVSRLGEAIVRGLDASLPRKPHPSNDAIRDSFKPVLKQLGSRSMADLNRRSVLIGVDRQGAVYSFVPTRGLGPRRGFVDLDGAAAQLEDPTVDEIGAAVISALSRSIRAEG